MATRLLSLESMQLERLSLEPGAATAWGPPGDERFLYVIHGAGSARVGTDELRLAQESVLWLEPGERTELTAGAEGLHVLGAGASGPALAR